MIMTREEVSTNLKSAVATVVFEKVDGTLRTMRCTLMEQYLPDRTEKMTGKTPNESSLAVWDLDNGGWRSFRLDSIREISYSTVKEGV